MYLNQIEKKKTNVNVRVAKQERKRYNQFYTPLNVFKAFFFFFFFFFFLLFNVWRLLSFQHRVFDLAYEWNDYVLTWKQPESIPNYYTELIAQPIGPFAFILWYGRPFLINDHYRGVLWQRPP